MNRAVIYARYSSASQTEQSIEGQLAVCKKFAKENDYVILDTYIDRAMTGTNDHRPSFQKMIRESCKREWDYVIVYKGDRFSRNRYESALYKKALKDNGVKLVSATENIPDSPEGIILESLLEGMSEYYSAELSQKVKRGLEESRKKKQFTGGNLIYGYDIKNKKPVINENQAAVVRRIFDWQNNNVSASKIVDILEREGISKANGKPFTTQDVYRIYKQEKYYDSDIYPPIIDSTVADVSKSVRKARLNAPARNKASENYILSGRLFCGQCGNAMTGESGTSVTGKTYSYYKCCHKKKKKTNCTVPNIRKEYLEKKVFEACCAVLSNGFITKVVDISYEMHQKELNDSQIIKNLRKAIKDKQKSIDNILDALEKGIYNSSTQDRMLKLEEEKKQLEYNLDAEIAKAEESVSRDDYRDFIVKFIGGQVDNEQFKKDLIDLLVRKIVVFKDRICITFNFSPDRGKGRRRIYKIDETDRQEFTEIQNAYDGECSDFVTLAPPKNTNPNYTVFVATKYWGVWFDFKKKR